MCGIIGYTGLKPALPILLEGLSALEYRGYDSAGVACFDKDGLSVTKSSGRLSKLAAKLENGKRSDAFCGIGHTRWATHGEPSDENSHPHGNGRVYVVHNGIIENYAEIKAFLLEKGYTFASETDTEAAALLIDYYYSVHKDAILALRHTRDLLEGSYAFGVTFADIKGTVFAMRRDSPLLVSPSEVGMFIESDISAVIAYTRKFVRLEEGEIAKLSQDKIEFFDASGNRIEKEFEEVSWSVDAVERGGYPHFMLKEINEEPEAILKTLRPRMKDNLPMYDLLGLSEESIRNISKIHIVACGTAMHAGLIGKYAIEKLARIPVSVEIASEFRYNDPIINENDIVLIISQSGETADSLAALRLAKEKGIKTIALVNVPGSTIAREADSTVYTWAGPEIAVASTKAYSVQTALLYLSAIHLAYSLGKLDKAETQSLVKSLLDSPGAVSRAIALSDKCKTLAKKYCGHKNIFFIGRGHDYPLAMEAALKMKEISYIHCEAYAAGELKHGTISLIERGTAVFAFATQTSVLEKMISNIREVTSRGADVLLFVSEGSEIPENLVSEIIEIPRLPELFMPLSAVTPTQLLAYHSAVELGCDVDKPRNLAKSVTVE